MKIPTDLGATALLALLAGCQTTAPAPPTAPAPTDPFLALAEELSASAEQRTDLSSMRVVVDRVHAGSRSATVALSTREAATAEALQSELAFALASQLHVVGPDLIENSDPPEAAADLLRLAREHEATHVFTASYAEKGEAVQITARLLDVETKVVVGTARARIDPALLELPRAVAGPAPRFKAPKQPWHEPERLARGPDLEDPLPSDPPVLELQLTRGQDLPEVPRTTPPAPAPRRSAAGPYESWTTATRRVVSQEPER